MTLSFIESRAPPANPQSFATPARSQGTLRGSKNATPRIPLFSNTHCVLRLFPLRRRVALRQARLSSDVRHSRIGNKHQHPRISRSVPACFKIRRARDCARNVRPSRAANNDPHPRAPGALALSLKRARALEMDREKEKGVETVESEFTQ